MAAIEILLYAIGAVALYYVYQPYLSNRGHYRRQQWQDRESMPDIMRDATLYGSEQMIRCRKPVPLNGRYDQLYQCADDDLILVDSKRRASAQVYDSDVIQLSVYCTILEYGKRRGKSQIVKPYGFIRLVVNGCVHYQKVSLLNHDQVCHLYQRYVALLQQRTVLPQGAAHAGLCRTCGHQSRCPQPVG